MNMLSRMKPTSSTKRMKSSGPATESVRCRSKYSKSPSKARKRVIIELAEVE